MIKNILVATDFSFTSDEAVEYAVVLANKLGAHLDVVHVFCEPAMPSFYGAGSLLMYGNVPDLEEEALSLLQMLKEKISANYPDVSVHLHKKKPVSGILKAIETLNPDLVIVGSHGLTGIRKVVIGSVADGVVHKAACPVLVFKTQKTLASLKQES